MKAMFVQENLFHLKFIKRREKIPFRLFYELQFSLSILFTDKPAFETSPAHNHNTFMSFKRNGDCNCSLRYFHTTGN